MVRILTYGSDSLQNLVEHFVKDKAEVLQIAKYQKEKCELLIVFDTVRDEELLMAADLVVNKMMFELHPEIEVNLILNKLRTKIRVGQYSNKEIRKIWLRLT